MHSGKVLALQFRNYDHNPIDGKWVLPGGRPDVGENVYEALKREVREESGLEIDILCPMHINNFRNLDGLERIRISYFCKPIGIPKVTLSEEHKAHKWITAEESEALDWIDTDFKVIVKEAIGRCQKG